MESLRSIPELLALIGSVVATTWALSRMISDLSSRVSVIESKIETIAGLLVQQSTKTRRISTKKKKGIKK
jgi:hypothetical protein